MKLTGCVLWILYTTKVTVSFNPEALDYVLRTIAYLKRVDSGVLSCVFYDLTLQHTFDNILGAILKSPQLDQVVKYVISGSYEDDRPKLPRDPSVLLIHAGNDAVHLGHPETIRSLVLTLRLFNPATNVLVFVNQSDELLVRAIDEPVRGSGFNHPVFMDSTTMHGHLCNSFWCWKYSKSIQPIYLFSLGARFYTGRNITYFNEYSTVPYTWNVHWMDETARFLNTVASQRQHSCGDLHGVQLIQCLNACNDSQYLADIILEPMFNDDNFPRDFDQLFTGLPTFSKIAVPRDRPLNIAELLLLPFTWQLWLLLTIILTSAGLVTTLFPNWFRNDPFLLAVCGFERHNLHRAGRFEKVAFLSLIIVMFFLTNAFETKIVSLMVERPSIQRIKTLEDLQRSHLKFYVNLNSDPFYARHSIVGKLAVHSDKGLFAEKVADACMLWPSHIAEVMHDVSFDYEQRQPFYVLLGYEFYEGPELYQTHKRDPFLKTFQFIHRILVDAGLFNLWKQQWKDQIRFEFLGRSAKVDFPCKVNLDFDDMRSAWIILAVGLGVGVVGFCAELIIKHSRKLKMKSIRYPVFTWKS